MAAARALVLGLGRSRAARRRAWNAWSIAAAHARVAARRQVIGDSSVGWPWMVSMTRRAQVGVSRHSSLQGIVRALDRTASGRASIIRSRRRAAGCSVCGSGPSPTGRRCGARRPGRRRAGAGRSDRRARRCMRGGEAMAGIGERRRRVAAAERAEPGALARRRPGCRHRGCRPAHLLDGR